MYTITLYYTNKQNKYKLYLKKQLIYLLNNLITSSGKENRLITNFNYLVYYIQEKPNSPNKTKNTKKTITPQSIID